jgi:hypothetical protein
MATIEERTNLTEQLREIGDNLGRLVRDHVELARSELIDGLRRSGRDVGLTLAGAGLAALGWVLLAFALGYGLAPAFGLARAFLLVAALHVVAGGVLVTVFARRLQRQDRPRLTETSRELRRDRLFWGEVRTVIRGQPRAR